LANVKQRIASPINQAQDEISQGSFEEASIPGVIGSFTSKQEGKLELPCVVHREMMDGQVVAAD